MNYAKSPGVRSRVYEFASIDARASIDACCLRRSRCFQRCSPALHQWHQYTSTVYRNLLEQTSSRQSAQVAPMLSYSCVAQAHRAASGCADVMVNYVHVSGSSEAHILIQGLARGADLGGRNELPYCHHPPNCHHHLSSWSNTEQACFRVRLEHS
jgi:hypothetical protein